MGLVHEHILVPLAKAHDNIAVDGFCWGGHPGALHWANRYWGDTLVLTGAGHVPAGGRPRTRIVIALEMFANRHRTCPLGL